MGWIYDKVCELEKCEDKIDVRYCYTKLLIVAFMLLSLTLYLMDNLNFRNSSERESFFLTMTSFTAIIVCVVYIIDVK